MNPNTSFFLNEELILLNTNDSLRFFIFTYCFFSNPLNLHTKLTELSLIHNLNKVSQLISNPALINILMENLVLCAFSLVYLNNSDGY
jgi:hypothetical protein